MIRERDMKVLGITGGVGSGKSEILKFLQEEYQAVICQLDEVARHLQQRGQECWRQIVETFGREMIGTDGELDREKLGAVVFADPEMLQKLNGIVHPEVKSWVRQDIRKKEQDGVTLYVIEAALLPTAGYEEICDEMWYIYTEEAVRRRRLTVSRGYSEEKITQMIQSQPSEEDFRKACTVVIDNSGSFENTKERIGELL